MGKTHKKAIKVNTLYAFSLEKGLNALKLYAFSRGKRLNVRAFYAFSREKALNVIAYCAFPCVFAINGKKINTTLYKTCPLSCKHTVYKNVKDYRILERKE
ncbi:MAG: hypothetical protein GX762_07505 [Bacteroidales bacterium]|nr:hypothetical protein [Bacteroidales bacterium]